MKTKAQYVIQHIDVLIEQANKSRAKWLAECTSAGAFVYQMDWANNIVIDQQVAKVCEYIKIGIEKVGIREALQLTHDDLHRKLIRNYLTGSSTSAISNAVQAAEREAASQMIEKCDSWIKQLDESDDA